MVVEAAGNKFDVPDNFVFLGRGFCGIVFQCLAEGSADCGNHSYCQALMHNSKMDPNCSTKLWFGRFVTFMKI